MARLTYELE
jgi:hypothetical protein